MLRQLLQTLGHTTRHPALHVDPGPCIQTPLPKHSDNSGLVTVPGETPVYHPLRPNVGGNRGGSLAIQRLTYHSGATTQGVSLSLLRLSHHSRDPPFEALAVLAPLFCRINVGR
jgi:hypothetical protein